MKCCGRGENRDSPLCPRAGNARVVARDMAAPWDREGCPCFLAVCR